MQPRPGFRRDVEGLRGLAVLFVLAHHAGEGLWAGGFIGVDVFFVISGFVITTQLVKEVERTGTVTNRDRSGRALGPGCREPMASRGREIVGEP